MNVDDVFMSRVAHDLRGELATMVAGVHYLLRYEADLAPSARQMLDRVDGAGQRLRRLLDEFDNAVWIGGGDPSALGLESCQLRPLVDEAITRLRSAVAAREVAVDLQIAEDLPAIEADPYVLGAAIEYVIDFALARSRKRTVRISCAMADGAPVLTVVDEGGPLAPDVLATLLEPFAERDVMPKVEPGQRRRERLGLGLSIARGVFEAHGGRLSASAAPEGVMLACVVATTAATRATQPASPSSEQLRKMA